MSHLGLPVCTSSGGPDWDPSHMINSYCRQQANFQILCDHMKQALFVRSFRMKYDIMQKLYTHIADTLYCDPVQARTGSGEPIYPVL